MGTYATVKSLFTAICDAIRAKDGTAATIAHQDIPDRIAAIKGGDPTPYFLRPGTDLRYLIMAPTDGYEVTLSVTADNQDSRSVTWGDGSEDAWTADSTKHDMTHTYKQAGVYEITVSATQEATNNLSASLNIDYGNIIGTSFGKQVKNTADAPVVGTEWAMGMLRVQSAETTYSTFYQDQSTYPSSLVILQGHKPNISGNNAINKFYCSDYAGGGSYLLAYCRGMMQAYLKDFYTIGASTFASDTKLQRVYLYDSGAGSSGYTIGAKAFDGCTDLFELIIDLGDTWDASRIPTLDATALQSSGIASSLGKIYISDNFIWQLKGATNWSEYADKIYPLSEYKGETYHGED